MSRRSAALVAVWTLPTLIFVVISYAVFNRYRIHVPARLGADARAEVMRVLRAAVEKGEAGQPAHPELSRALPDQAPAVVTVWSNGRRAARVDAYGDTIANAVAVAARVLAANPTLRRMSAGAKRDARIKVDLIVARGYLAKTKLFRTIGFNPGLDGLGAEINWSAQLSAEQAKRLDRGDNCKPDGDKRRCVTHALLLPEELVLQRLLSAKRPIDFVKEFNFGLDFERAQTMLIRLAQLPAGAYSNGSKRFYRFRTDSFVERPAETREQGPPLALYRGLPVEGPELSADTLRQAAINGGKYLVAHLAPNGRYIYERELHSGQGTSPRPGGPYSLPRHAGTTYFLAELYRHIGPVEGKFLLEPIQRAFDHLQQLINQGGCSGILPNGKQFVCVKDRGHTVANLGSSALAVVALAEYERAVKDGRYAKLTRALAEWILYMQKDNGDFCHLYHVRSQRRDEHTQLLYFTGEAALAMARSYKIFGDERYLRASERGLDYLIGWYDFFGGGFFYGEDHWTCIAAEAIWPDVKKDRYRTFCQGYGTFLRTQQPIAGEFGDQDDFAGSYGLSPYVVPHNTPAGSRTEAMISAYTLGQHHNKPDPRILTQIKRAMRYTLRQQINANSNWFVAPKVSKLHGIGAVPATPVDRTVRIDYVQHVCSAMLRTSHLLGTGTTH